MPDIRLRPQKANLPDRTPGCARVREADKTTEGQGQRRVEERYCRPLGREPLARGDRRAGPPLPAPQADHRAALRRDVVRARRIGITVAQADEVFR